MTVGRVTPGLAGSQMEALAPVITAAFETRGLELPLKLGAATVLTRAMLAPLRPDVWFNGYEEEQITPDMHTVKDALQGVLQGVEVK